MTDCTDCQGEFTQDPEDNLDYTVDFERWLVEWWSPGTSVTLASFRRPRIATGFEYECTQAGQTARKEPLWPKTIGLTVRDGSVIWTCRALSNASLKATLQTANWAIPSGITQGAATIIGQRATVMLSGGADGEDYAIRCEGIMSNGAERNVNFTLKIRRAPEDCVAQ